MLFKCTQIVSQLIVLKPLTLFAWSVFLKAPLQYTCLWVSKSESGLDTSRYLSHHHCLVMAVYTYSTISWSNWQLQVVFAMEDALCSEQRTTYCPFVSFLTMKWAKKAHWKGWHTEETSACRTQVLVQAFHLVKICNPKLDSWGFLSKIWDKDRGIGHYRGQNIQQKCWDFPTCESPFFLSGIWVSHMLVFC